MLRLSPNSVFDWIGQLKKMIFSAWTSETPLCKFPKEKVLVQAATSMKASGGKKLGELVEFRFLKASR